MKVALQCLRLSLNVFIEDLMTNDQCLKTYT